MKALLIGIDGASWDVFSDNVLEKHMPNLWKLRNTGTFGALESTFPNFITPAAWPTAISGVMPHKHGLNHFYRYRFEDNKIHNTNASMLKMPNIFHYLGQDNLTTAMINVPSTFPAYPTNGYSIAGMGCPGTNVDFTYPPDLKQSLLERIPDYVINVLQNKEVKNNLKLSASRQDFDLAMQRIEQILEQRCQAAELINELHTIDVMMVQFQHVDCLKHICWPYFDPDDRDNYPWFRDRIYGFYEKLDSLIGKLLELASEETLTVVMSDHGFGNSPYSVNPNRMLIDWGYLKPLSTTAKLARRIRLKLAPKYKSRTSLPVSLRYPINWNKTRAMVLMRPLYGVLYFNVKGRQPGGLVNHEDVPAMIEDLKTRFSEILCPFTGRKVFEQIVTPSEFFGQDGLEETFGDLMLIQNYKYHIRISPKKKLKYIAETTKGTVTASTHYPEGIYIINGDNIKPGHRVKAHIADLAPTIYSWLNMNIPAEVDGKTIESAFITPPRIEKNTQQSFPLLFETGKLQAGLSQEEEARLAEQLEGLGYM